MNIIFDLDGTLADISHRLHHIQESPRDFDAFHADAWADTPIYTTIDLLNRLLASGANVQIWSGRSASVRDETLGWLHDYGVSDAITRLRLRPDRNYTADHLLKKQWLEEARAGGFEPDLVFEDRTRVVEMWRAEGIPCFQVAPGDF